MEVLKTPLVVLVFTLSACVAPIEGTVTIPLETDSYISSRDDVDHSELPYTQVYKSFDGEDRIIFKFPTGKNNEDEHLIDCRKNTLCDVFLFPITLIKAVLSVGSCSSLASSDIVSAQLRFNTENNEAFGPGQLDLHLLEKPYWQGVSWTRAYPFSDQGKWTRLGGDYDFDDSQFNFPTNVSTCSINCHTGDVVFDVTNYFKQLVSQPEGNHYGAIVVPTGNVAQTRFVSVQAGGDRSPRVQATVNCPGALNFVNAVYYLGNN